MAGVEHLFIPDTQVKPDVPLQHLTALGNYIVEKQPDVIVHIGDHADMPSLSLYDVGKRQFEGRRYRADIEAAQDGMEALLTPLWEYNARRAKNKMRMYRPRMILTLGNHEHRIQRAVDLDAKLEGTIGVDDLAYVAFGWEVYPFLQPVRVDGINYVHYVQHDNSPGAVSRAHLIAARRHGSYSVGHRQTLDYYVSPHLNPDTGKRMQVLMCGAYYQHNEDYMGPQGNQHWRGVVHKKEVDNGQYDPQFLSIDYMLRRWL